MAFIVIIGAASIKFTAVSPAHCNISKKKKNIRRREDRTLSRACQLTRIIELRMCTGAVRNWFVLLHRPPASYVLVVSCKSLVSRNTWNSRVGRTLSLSLSARAHAHEAPWIIHPRGAFVLRWQTDWRTYEGGKRRKRREVPFAPRDNGCPSCSIRQHKEIMRDSMGCGNIENSSRLSIWLFLFRKIDQILFPKLIWIDSRN